MSKVDVLLMGNLPDATARDLAEGFTVHRLPKTGQDEVLDEVGPAIRGMAVRQTNVPAALLARLPALEIIACFSAGLDRIDTGAARERGIVVRNGSVAVADDVADMAVALLVASLRRLVRGDAFVRDGTWARRESFPLGRSLGGLRVGIVGMGHIGVGVAHRLAAMRCEVAYTGPNRKPLDWRYFPDPVALADWAEALVVACPSTPATRHLIDARVLAALGPQGTLVNVARGVVVDEAALIDALARDALAGAGLDVFEHEPEVPEALRRDPRVTLSPHNAGGTEEALRAMGAALVTSLRQHFAARP